MENTESLDADVILPGAEFRRMRAEIEALNAEVARCHERLEMTHRYQCVNPETGETARVDIPREKRGFAYDGIDCRNETIKGLDDLCDELEADRDRLAAENVRLREAFGLLADYVGYYRAIIEVYTLPHVVDEDVASRLRELVQDMEGDEVEARTTLGQYEDAARSLVEAPR